MHISGLLRGFKHQSPDGRIGCSAASNQMNQHISVYRTDRGRQFFPNVTCDVRVRMETVTPNETRKHTTEKRKTAARGSPPAAKRTTKLILFTRRTLGCVFVFKRFSVNCHAFFFSCTLSCADGRVGIARNHTDDQFFPAGDRRSCSLRRARLSAWNCRMKFIGVVIRIDSFSGICPSIKVARAVVVDQSSVDV